ncbi:MAG: hypothetical protein PVJ45_03915 [Desulfobacterales bacterium]
MVVYLRTLTSDIIGSARACSACRHAVDLSANICGGDFVIGAPLCPAWSQ